jgi:hypothetical protein
MSLLRVLIDGDPLPDVEAIAFWKRFSVWMDENPADLKGFAEAEGFSSVSPEMHSGAPVLIASRSAPQKPYTSAPKKKR